MTRVVLGARSREVDDREVDDRNFFRIIRGKSRKRRHRKTWRPARSSWAARLMNGTEHGQPA